MKECCGFLFPDRWKYCPFCGKESTKSTLEAHILVRKASRPECGGDVIADFCMDCGHVIKAGEA